MMNKARRTVAEATGQEPEQVTLIVGIWNDEVSLLNYLRHMISEDSSIIRTEGNIYANKLLKLLASISLTGCGEGGKRKASVAHV